MDKLWCPEYRLSYNIERASIFFLKNDLFSIVDKNDWTIWRFYCSSIKRLSFFDRLSLTTNQDCRPVIHKGTPSCDGHERRENSIGYLIGIDRLSSIPDLQSYTGTWKEEQGK